MTPWTSAAAIASAFQESGQGDPPDPTTLLASHAVGDASLQAADGLGRPLALLALLLRPDNTKPAGQRWSSDRFPLLFEADSVVLPHPVHSCAFRQEVSRPRQSILLDMAEGQYEEDARECDRILCMAIRLFREHEMTTPTDINLSGAS